MRRRWIVVSVLAAVLSVGAIMGTALAQTDDSDGESDDGDNSSSVSRFVEVLAGKLDIGEEELQSAIDETREELRAEFEAAAEAKLIEKLDEMVAAGKITQEQADEYLSWYRDRPDEVKGFGAAPYGKGFSGHGHHGRRGGFGKGSGEGSSDATEESDAS